MKNNTDLSAREKILNAALDIFVAKGKEGARMQEIADHASVNKAMLFYYFTNKELLYKEVLRRNIIELVNQLKTIMVSEAESETKIENIVNAYINFFKNKPTIPKLILREATGDSETIKEVLLEIKQNVAPDIPDKFISMIQKSINEDEFYPLDPKQTIISIIGMSLIYFISKPIIEVLLDLEDVDPEQFIIERQDNILKILKHGLLQRSNNDN